MLDRAHDLRPFVFGWPHRPSWLYALTQGLHFDVGLIAVPFLLAKLWSVIPRLFAWPPVRSPAQAIERGSLAAARRRRAVRVRHRDPQHPALLPVALQLRRRALLRRLGLLRGADRCTSASSCRRDPRLSRPRRAASRCAPTSRDTRPSRSSLAVSRRPRRRRRRSAAAGCSPWSVPARWRLLVGLPPGRSTGGPLRQPRVARAARARLRPRAQRLPGQQDRRGRPVTAWRRPARLAAELIGDAHACSLSRGELLAMPQHTYDLPIACVEGWSTTQRWTGVRLRDLATLAGAPTGAVLHVESIQPQRRPSPGHARTTLRPRTTASLLALRVNGADLSLDHGYPARIIVPALPGVHCTKWVASRSACVMMPAMKRVYGASPLHLVGHLARVRDHGLRRSPSHRSAVSRGSTSSSGSSARRCSTTSCSCRSTRPLDTGPGASAPCPRACRRSTTCASRRSLSGRCCSSTSR